ncbi:WD-40 repeat protein [Reticulomyxa filosa]|uniref:WD-40 repeat protein n=1 Tax=Reticulomyxa filosa TaxID=46433 RepID=X6N3Z6_RETFI|nr:WD-40 repeat protein [Reticulomyxa filosa]|eukprot:ETO20032.1 WD-40 repeat protein [Reticulomyxa filosa]
MRLLCCKKKSQEITSQYNRRAPRRPNDLSKRQKQLEDNGLEPMTKFQCKKIKRMESFIKRDDSQLESILKQDEPRFIWQEMTIGKEIAILIRHWLLRFVQTDWGWIEEFNKIIANYVKALIISKTPQHNDVVENMQFSPDGSIVLSCSWDRTIRLWDVALQQEQKVLKGHTKGVKGARFSQMTIRLWNVASGNEIEIIAGIVTFATFSPDSNKILWCSYDKIIRLWDIASKKVMQKFEGHLSIVEEAQFSNDGLTIVSASADHTIRMWDVGSGNILRVLRGHLDKVTGIHFSFDDQTLVSCSWDETIQLWDVISGKRLKQIKAHTNGVTRVQFSPDGQTIVSCSDDKTIRLWDVNSGRMLQQLDEHSDFVTGAQFSPDVLGMDAFDFGGVFNKHIKKKKKNIKSNCKDTCSENCFLSLLCFTLKIQIILILTFEIVFFKKVKVLIVQQSCRKKYSEKDTIGHKKKDNPKMIA